MADRPGHIYQHGVSLAWAPYSESAPEQAAAARVRRSARELRVAGGDALAIRHQSRRRDGTDESRKKKLDARLRALGLPCSPWPWIPDEDRAPQDRETVISLAVALDVLATLSKTIEDQPDVLHRLTETLFRVGLLGGLDDARIDGLLEHAAGPAGRDRALLNRRLARCVAGVDRAGQSLPAPDPEATITQTIDPSAPSSPEAVTGVVRRIEETARMVVREATLLLQAREAIEYRQA